METTVRIVLVASDVRLDVAVPAHLPVLEVQDELVALAARAGATLVEGMALVAAGRGAIDLSATPHQQRIRHGDLWFLQPTTEPVPLRAHHDLAAAAADLVGRGRRPVDAEVRRLGLLGAAVLLGLALATLTVAEASRGAVPALWLALAPVGVLALCLVGLTRHRDRTTVVACVALVVAHAAALGVLAAPWLGPGGLGQGGLAGGMVLATLLLVWMPPGTREAALLPAVIGLGAGAPVLAGATFAGADLAGPLVTCVPVVLGLALGPLATALLDARVVRPHQRSVGEPDVVLSGTGVADGITSAVRLLVAVEVATVVLAVVATPRFLAAGRWGVLVWLALVALLVLRARGERLAVRALTAWVGSGALLCAGVVQVPGLAGGDPWDGVLLVLVPVALACLACCAGLLAGPGAGLPLRPVVWADRVVRVALPSLWLLSSGLLGNVR